MDHASLYLQHVSYSLNNTYFPYGPRLSLLWASYFYIIYPYSTEALSNKPRLFSYSTRLFFSNDASFASKSRLLLPRTSILLSDYAHYAYIMPLLILDLPFLMDHAPFYQDQIFVV